MHRIGLTLVVVVFVAAGLGAQQQIQFFASFTDTKGVPVTTLTEKDLRVSENGSDGKILKLEPIDWPSKLQLLVDNGTGLGNENLIHLRNGVRGFIEALPEGLETSLITTAPQPRNVVKPTVDRQALLKGVDLLTPDSGGGRFIEALNEAAARIDKEKGNYFPIVVVLGTTAAEGGTVIERDVTRMLQRYQQRAATVHVILFNSGVRSATSVTGANQTQVGLAVAQMTGGRYENIAAATRIASLLPEIGAQVAKSTARQAKQFRLTFERPNGSAPLGNIGLAGPGGLQVALSRDGHIP